MSMGSEREMPRIGCTDVDERLHRRAEGLLSPAEVGELDAHLGQCESCRRRATGLAWVSGRLQEGRPLPAGFGDRVLRRVAAEAGATRPVRPRATPLARWSALPVAAALVLAAGLAARGWLRPPAEAPVESPRVRVELELAKGDARTVAVAGDFNGWEAEGSKMKRGADGVWRIRLELPPGRYQYVFVVDGEQWMADPRASTMVDSGYSGSNSVLDVSL
jgi:hypothetical protein